MHRIFKNYAQIWKPIDNDKKYRAADHRFRGAFDGYGTKIGYANKDFMDLDVGLKLGSSSNWDPASASHTQTMKYFDGNTALGNSEAIYIGDVSTGTGTWVTGKQVRFLMQVGITL